MTTTLLAVLALSALQAPPARDTTYERLIREATTDPRFLPASVATIPEHPTIPSPRQHFGTIPGAPGVMHRSADLFGYYRALAAASPRVRVETVGRTEEARDLVLVTIADEATLAQLDRIKRGLAALADPRTTDRAAMERLVGEIKPVYYLMGGLHSPEMGPPEMLIELAYRLAVSDDPLIQRIRNNVVVLINPVAEPDGRDRQVDWYYRYTKGRPELDDGFPRSAPYWGKYVFHDNNRDGIQISQQLTKAVYRSYYDWHPLVIHDLHESVPLLYVSTGTGPYNFTVDPIIVAEWQTLANWDIQSLTKQGVPGVWTWGFFDGWWPGYAAWAATNHNAISRFYETFGNSGADTYLRDLRGQTYAGDSVTTAQWYRPWPPTAKVRWSLRNNTNLMQGGVLSSLDYAARNARDLLINFWQKGVNSIERGRTRAPHAFLIPALEKQRDPRRAAYLVNQLQRHAIEVHRSTDTLPGSFVVKLDQPYRDLAVNLLSKQDYPSSARYPPYDDIAWTLGLMYGVEVQPVNDPKVLTWRGLELLRDSVSWRGSVSRATAAGGSPGPSEGQRRTDNGQRTTGNSQGASSSWLVRYTAQAELLPALYALRQREARAAAFAAETTFTASGTEWAAGTVILEGPSAAGAEWLAQEYGLALVQAPAPAVRRHALDLPRVAIYHTWFSTQDEGWVRYWFDQLGIPYTSIHKDDLRSGNLRRRFDVILVPTAGGQGPQWIHEIDTKWGPLPFTKTAEFASHGTPSSTADMTGGPGFLGMAELERFLDQGGTLITIENATRLATETGLIRELQEFEPSGLFHPGSLVTAKARRPSHPVLYGFPETTHVFRGNAPLWRTARRDRGFIVLQYGTEALADERDTVVAEIMGMEKAARAEGAGGAERGGALQAAGEETGARGRGQPYVLSGMVRNSNQIVGHGAVFDVPAGKNDAGRVIAFTFNPLHRFLNHHDAPMVFNALLNWNDR